VQQEVQLSNEGGGRGSEDLGRARHVGVGCFTAFVGFWSGGMIGVLVGKLVGAVRKCTPPEGLPACDWYWYAAAGMLLGAVTLPTLALRRLRRGRTE
jgi:hypothetical protein